MRSFGSVYSCRDGYVNLSWHGPATNAKKLLGRVGESCGSMEWETKILDQMTQKEYSESS